MDCPSPGRDASWILKTHVFACGNSWSTCVLPWVETMNSQCVSSRVIESNGTWSVSENASLKLPSCVGGADHVVAILLDWKSGFWSAISMTVAVTAILNEALPSPKHASCHCDKGGISVVVQQSFTAGQGTKICQLGLRTRVRVGVG